MFRQLESLGSQNGGMYECLDTQPLAGLNYYRLSQTGLDGSMQYLGIKAVRVAGNNHFFSISPNPIENNQLTIHFEPTAAFDGVLEVLNTDGKVIATTALTLEKGSQRIKQALGDIPPGIYLLHIYGGQHKWSSRFLKYQETLKDRF